MKTQTKRVVNTGHISYLKAKGYGYVKEKTISKEGKRVVDFIFTIPVDETKICEDYWKGGQVSAIAFKRELDSTRQEIEDFKNNWNN